jgi:hypothetical protein
LTKRDKKNAEGSNVKFINADSMLKRLLDVSPCEILEKQENLILDPRDADDMIEKVSKRAVGIGDLSEGDLAVINAGHPVRVAGLTNMIWVERCR